MGVGWKVSSSSISGRYDSPRVPGNPDPKNYKLLRAASYSDKHLILEIQYPDCTNYEGLKILVYENTTIEELIRQKLIDPHFHEPGGKYKSPIARFEPTSKGWELAEAFVSAIYKP